jgi:hypothetical protein
VTFAGPLLNGGLDLLLQSVARCQMFPGSRSKLRDRIVRWIFDQFVNNVHFNSVPNRSVEDRHPVFAVGTPVTRRPSHRSQRAELPHWAPTSGSDVHAQVRVWMTNAGPWEPAVNESVHSFPVEAMALATTKQHFVPKTTHMEVK